MSGQPLLVHNGPRIRRWSSARPNPPAMHGAGPALSHELHGFVAFGQQFDKSLIAFPLGGQGGRGMAAVVLV